MQENNVSENQLPFTLYAEKAKLTLTGEHELLSAGMTGVVQVEFLFSEDWNGLEKTAVFTNGTRTVKVSEAYWDDGVCVIPHEVLRTAGKTVMAGVYGTNGLHLVLPTVWCVLGRVEPAPDLSGEAVDPGPSLRAMERRLAALEQIPAVTEDTVSGWGFTKNAITQQSLDALVPRGAQATKTGQHNERVAIDANGALYCAGGNVRLIRVSYYNEAYHAEMTPAQIYEALSEGETPFVLIDQYGRQCPLVFPPEDELTGAAKFFTIDSSGSELVIHTVSAAGVVTTQSVPIPTRTSDLNNDSGYLRRFPISISTVNGITTADKTFSQIQSAMQSGAVIDVVVGTLHGWVGDTDGSSVTLYVIDDSGGQAVLFNYNISALGVTANSRVIENTEPVTLTVNDTAPSIAAEHNRIYECGTITSLTVSSAPSLGEFTIIFTSGASPTALTLPQSIASNMPAGFAPAANTRYEISVRKNYPVIGSWAVSA